MKNTTNTRHGLFADQADGIETDDLIADLLRSEIAFWQGMIESLDRNRCSRGSVERMQQALALAEYRLANLDVKELPSSRPPRLC